MPKVIVTSGTKTVQEIVVVENTPQAIVNFLHPDTKNFPTPMICIYEGKPLLRKHWNRELHADDVIVFSEVPLGGGGGGGSKNPLAMIGMIIVTVVAAIVTWGASAYLQAAGWAAWAANAVGSIAGMAVMMAGSMLVGALSPTASVPSAQSQSIQNEQISPTYSVSDNTNRARLYQAEPEGFGRMKIVPDVVAQTYFRYIGSEFYLFAVYGCGRGEYVHEQLFFGDTVFWRDGAIIDSAYGNVELEFVPEGGAVTLFPDNIESSPEVAGIELKTKGNGGVMVGPYAANPPGSKTDTIVISYTAPQGVWTINASTGAYINHTISFVFYYRLIDDAGNPLSGFATLYSKTITSNSRQPIRETHEVKLPLGRYEVSAEATFNGKNDGRTGEQIVWEQLFSILPGTRAYPQSCIAVKIKADNTLSQEASKQFKIIQTRKLPLWNNGTWTEPTPTSSLAAAISHVCKSSLGGKLEDRQIDLAALWAIDTDLQKKGWDFNYWLDGATLLWPMVQEWCSSCLVTPRLMGTTISFIQDKADRPVKYDITPYHIIRGSFSIQYITWSDDTPDDVIIEYLDKDYGYAQKDVRAVLPTSESKTPSRRNAPFITNRPQAHAVGVHASACNRWRRIEVTFDVGGVGRFMYIGDIFTLKHPRVNNLFCAPVHSFDASAYKIYTEQPIKKPISDAYYVGFTLPNGASWGPVLCSIFENEITLDATDYALLLQQGFVPLFDKIIPDHTDGLPTILTIYTSKMVPERMIVQSVKPKDLYSFTIVAMQDHPNVYAYNIPVPPLDYVGPTGGGDIVVIPPQGLSADILKNGEMRIVTFNWLPVTGAVSYKLDHSEDGENWLELGQATINRATYEINQGQHNVRIKSVGTINESAYTFLHIDTEMELPEPPQPILSGGYTNALLKIEWASVGFNAQYKVHVLHEGVELYSVGIAALQWEFTPMMQVDAGGPWRTLSVGVSAINVYGESEQTLLTVQDLAPAAPQNVQVTGVGNSVTVNGNREGADVTGWIVARVSSPELTDLSTVIESKIVQSLPVTFTELDLTQVNYIAVAQKDGFFDVSGNIFDLNFTVYSIGGDA